MKDWLSLALYRLGLGCFLAASIISTTAAPVISPGLAVPPEVDQGELLWTELNCAACHSGVAASGRPGPRVAPALGPNGIHLTPQFVREWVMNPHAMKPGTTMPDILSSLSGSQRSEAVEGLVHFLASAPDESEKGFSAQAGKIAQGRALFHTVGCVACHAPQESWQAVMNVEPKTPIDPQLMQGSVPIGPLAKKTTVGQMAAFFKDPLKYRKSGRMPSSNLSQADAEAIAMYLLRDQGSSAPSAGPKKLAGLNYEYYEANFGSEPNWDTLKPALTGTIEGFSVAPKRRDQSFGFRYTGSIEIAKAGTYRFFTVSDDSSRLWIDDKLVVDNIGDHAPEEKSGNVQLSEGAHSITVTFYNNGAGYELRVQWQPPGGRRQAIPSEILSHSGQPMLPVGAEQFARDPAKAETGKAVFASLGCAACHEHSEVPRSVPRGKELASMASSGGCLDQKIKDGLPDYHLSDEQRSALQKFLGSKANLADSLSPEAQIRYTMASFNCYACHTRDAKGGPTNARLQYFFGIGQADLGDEGRIPPHLTKVGQKLRREAILDIVEKGASVRPYMGTRMPQFGHAVVGKLPELFEQADLPATAGESTGTELDAKWGRKLVGVGGLACIQCHTFGGRKSLGVPAVDMTLMTKRLRKDWFHRYLLDPQSLRPGTRMPTFFPNGEAANKEILGGNTDAQINAIWAYLSKGRDADLPQGLVTGKKEIVADKEAVIYRNFIRGASPRGIGVGYPEKANLVFDANTLNIAEIWQGAFIDASRHSSGRGEGFEPPLGDRIYQLPQGPAFAVLAGADAPWPSGAITNAHMRGYQLDQKRRPMFRYSVGDAQIEDFPVATEGEVDPYFKRALKISGNAENLWFRAASGNRIEASGNGRFVVDGRVTFKVSGADATVRKVGDHSELVAPVKLNNGHAEIVEEIRW